MRRTLIVTPIAMLMASTAFAADEDVDVTPGTTSQSMESTRSDPGVPSDALDAGPSITAGITKFNEVLIDDYKDVELTDGTVYREPRTVRFDTDADGQLDTEGEVVAYRNRADGSSVPALYYVDIDGDRDPETWIIRRSGLATSPDGEYTVREDAQFTMREDIEAEDNDRFVFDPEFDFWDDDDVAYGPNDEGVTLLGSQRSPGAPATATGEE